MTAPPGASPDSTPPATPRSRFRRRRSRVAAAFAAVAAGVAGTGILLVAPRGLASVRFLDVSLGWWGAMLAGALELAVLAMVARGGER